MFSIVNHSGISTLTYSHGLTTLGFSKPYSENFLVVIITCDNRWGNYTIYILSHQGVLKLHVAKDS